ncbi:MAG: hypothetical protein ABJF10_06420 [Chthoniobacter sp.]|uniref:hypothetical protein n=1 Tax=Chthoniobacter sp. TaxID=2510640 RepID=UPI0032ACB4B8
MSATATPALLNKAQLAEAIGVCPRQINVMMTARQIPVIRLSRNLVRFDLEKVLAALAVFEQPAIGGRA